MGTWWDVLAKALEDLPSSLVSRDLGIGLRDTASATQVSQTNAVSEVFFGQPSPIQLGSLPGLGRNENIMNFLNSPAPSNYPQFKHELSCEGDVRSVLIKDLWSRTLTQISVAPSIQTSCTLFATL